VVLPEVLLAGCGGSSRATGEGEAAKPSVTRGTDRAEAKPGVPAVDNAAEPAAAPNQVVIDNFAFRPARLTVAAGTKVTWVNRDDVPHTATSKQKPRLFDSGALDTDDRFAHTFTAPGTYDYFCAVHPHMTAQIIVK
jgi:plastocyanin